MSYTSDSLLGKQAKLSRVKEIVELLGYTCLDNGGKCPDCVGNYMWFEGKEYKSWSGVELSLYKNQGSLITVSTRSTISRSYWDLVHQNRTLKMLRDLFGGYFTTDAGRNRYWRPYGTPPSPKESGCFLARWRLHNALIKPTIYLSQRGLTESNASPTPCGISFLDELNPRFFSNNLVLPYAVAVWEEFFRASFVALLKFSSNRERVFKKVKLNKFQLESIASNNLSVEEAVAGGFSFQRPMMVASNFRDLDPKLDLAQVLKKPYRNRKISLFDSIESTVECRNEFVHSGQMDIRLTDSNLSKLLSDFEVAAQRCYEEFSQLYGFELESYHW